MKDPLRSKVSFEEVRCLAEAKVPARIDSHRAAALLGFAEHDIPVLVSARLLRPLGKPGQNSVKYYATQHIVSLAHDDEWLDKATAAIQRYWKSKRSKRRGNPESGCLLEAAA